MSKKPEVINQQKNYTNKNEIIVGLVRKDNNGSKFFESFFSFTVKKTDYNYLTLVDGELVMTKIPPDTLKPGRLLKFKKEITFEEKLFMENYFGTIKDFLCRQKNY